jgi:cyclopropane fatty-acyl-phospholipid synthase-like methyltransferase
MSGNNPDFNNSAFWDRRYTENPALGSGVGSRAENLLHKRRIIETFLHAATPQTVLDVGCGDHEVLRDLEYLPGYTGIDVSAVAVEMNNKRFPHRQFKRLDFTDLASIQEVRSDVVLCMEVLIHQHCRESYDVFVRNLVAAASRGGLVSGYLFDPRPAISSDIIAWHEPVTNSLQRAGAKSVVIEARSLESDCLAFVSFRI